MLFFHGLLTVFLLAIFCYDLTRYIIPNWMTGVLLLLYPAMLFSAPSLPEGFSIWVSLMVFGVVFVVGIAVFALKWMGGGDVKLLAVLSLWTGAEAVAPFLVYTGLLGGVMALVLVLIRPMVGRFVPVEKVERIPRFLRHREPLPYGLAITIAFLIVLWMGEVPGMPVDYL